MFDVKESAKSFLCEFYNDNSCNYCVNVKPYEHSNVIESITFQDALEKFENDFKDIFDYSGHKLPLEKVFECVCNIWKKHLVKFN